MTTSPDTGTKDDLTTMIAMVGRHIRDNVPRDEEVHHDQDHEHEHSENEALAATIIRTKFAIVAGCLDSERKHNRTVLWSVRVPISVVSHYVYAVSWSGELLEWNPFLRSSDVHPAGSCGGWVRRSVNKLPESERSLALALTGFHARNLGLLEPAY